LPKAHDGPWPRVPASAHAPTWPRRSGSVTTHQLTHGTADWPPRPCAPSTALRFFCETIIEAKSPFTFSSSPSHSSSFSVALPPPLPYPLCAIVGRRQRPRASSPPQATTTLTVSHRAEDRLKAVGHLRLHFLLCPRVSLLLGASNLRRIQLTPQWAPREHKDPPRPLLHRR
jgi:hypothetical protein